MRCFTSYGPVNPKIHYAVPRTALIEECVNQLVGLPEEGGHFFTIWGPRQTGKTWIMRRAMEEIRARHGDRFQVETLSMQGISARSENPDAAFLRQIPVAFRRGMNLKIPPLADFSEWGELFGRDRGLFERPLILLIDEFDRIRPSVIDELVGQFRDLYLNRETSLLHGLGLVGVRAVLGVDSERGSPFNVQRSLHVPNLAWEEVEELFRQYQTESHQLVEPAVVRRIYEVTRGQPGLVSWFGELLTQKYNRGAPAPITLPDWEQTYESACTVEPNNTILNLLKKARDERFRPQVVDLFQQSNVPFNFDEDWCNYLYLNGIVTYEEGPDQGGRPTKVCRFSSPFVQHRLFNAFSRDMAGLVKQVPAVDPRVNLTSVLDALDLPALLTHYRDYLRRAKASGNNPWHGHPSRADLHLREAVGHFHLYWWLTQACTRPFLISPEFPTGNGKVDLHIRRGERSALLEVKSFTTQAELPAQREQAARYARSRDLTEATLALFVPSEDEEVITALSATHTIPIDGQDIRVITVAIAAV